MEAFASDRTNPDSSPATIYSFLSKIPGVSTAGCPPKTKIKNEKNEGLRDYLCSLIRDKKSKTVFKGDGSRDWKGCFAYEGPDLVSAPLDITPKIRKVKYIQLLCRGHRMS